MTLERWVLSLLIVLFSVCAYPAIHKCKNANGQWVFTDKPSACNKAPDEKGLEAPPALPSLPETEKPPSIPSQQPLAGKFQIKQNKLKSRQDNLNPPPFPKRIGFLGAGAPTGVANRNSPMPC